jgi:hypothetical protein
MGRFTEAAVGCLSLLLFSRFFPSPAASMQRILTDKPKCCCGIEAISANASVS